MTDYRLTEDDLPEEPLRPETLEEEFATFERMHDRVDENGLLDPWSAGMIATSYIQNAKETTDEYGEQVFVDVVNAIFWPALSQNVERLKEMMWFLVVDPPSTATAVQYASGRDDVAYFGFFKPEAVNLVVPSTGTLLPTEAVFTMVRDAGSGVWRPWSLGPMIHPDEIPADPTLVVDQ